MKKLLILCQVYHPDKSSTSQLLYPLFSSLRSQGWDIEIVSGFPSSPVTHRLPRTETLNNVRVRRCGLRLPLKQNFFYRVLTYCSYSFGAFRAVWHAPKDQVVLGISNPPFVLHTLGIVSWIQKRKFFFYLHDLHPEGLIALGKLRQGSLVTRIWIYCNRRAYNRAEKILVLGRDMIPILIKRYALSAKKIRYAPHWSPVSPLKLSPGSVAGRPTLSDTERPFIVQYSGNMGLWHDMNTIIQAARLMRHNKNIWFEFIGNGIKRDEAYTLGRHYSLTNLVWADFVPIDNLYESLRNCDVAIVSMLGGLEGIAVPCKLYGILAAGRPVIAQVPKKSEIALTISEHKCGLVVHPDDPNALAEAIRYLFTNPTILEEYGANGFQAYKQLYNVSYAAKQLADCFKSAEFS